MPALQSSLLRLRTITANLQKPTRTSTPVVSRSTTIRYLSTTKHTQAAGGTHQNPASNPPTSPSNDPTYKPPAQPGINRPKSVPGSSSKEVGGQDKGSADTHPAKQPDDGPAPTRSTGIKSENADRTEGVGREKRGEGLGEV